jgi:hypothetical protein
VLINDLPGLDTLSLHVDGLLGQSFLRSRPYLIDYSGRRLWFGDEAVAMAQDFGRQTKVELWSGRPVLLVGVNSKAKPLHLILDSGVNSVVIRCVNPCEALVDEHIVRAVTNAGEMAVRKGRLPFAVIGAQKFFSMGAVLIGKSSDINNADGSVPLRWFSAVYVDPVQKVIRFLR